jgi:adenylylsulfate kinase
MDGTAYKLSMRKRAREKMGNRFAEVYVRCSVETAMKRESQRENGLVMADLYKKALERKRTGKDYPGLGEVIGVDVEFEEDKNAELIIENDELTLDQAVSKVLEFIDSLSRASECLCQR